MMVRIIGNNSKIFVARKVLFLATAFLCTPAYVHGAVSVQLTLTDQANNKLVQARVGEPFFCVVTVNGVGSDTYYPRVLEIDPFLVQPRPDIVHDDKSGQVYYKYCLRVDDQGYYRFGPAEVTDGVHRYYSDDVGVVVGAKKIVDNTSKKQDKKQLKRPWAVFTVDSSVLYTEQPVRCEVRAYFPNDRSYAFQGVFPQIPHGFKQSMQHGVEQFEETIDGQRYVGVLTSWIMYPEAVGKYMIPGCKIDFLVHESSRSSFGGFMSFMFNSTRQDTMHSNTIHLEVRELPEYTERPVSGRMIGRVSDLSMTSDKDEIAVGEGAVITVLVTGDSGLEAMKDFSLRNLPSGVRMYPSKDTITPPSGTEKSWVKRFEYVMQGISPGAITLPKQEIACFDVTMGAYTVVQSNTLSLKITGSIIADNHDRKEEQQNNIVENKGDDVPSDNPLPDMLLPLVTTGWYALPETPCRWYIFWILFFSPFFIAVLYAFFRMFAYYAKKNAVAVRRRMAWYKAYWRIKKARRNQRDDLLYGIIYAFITDKIGINVGVMSNDAVRKLLQDNNNDALFVAQWDEFANMVALSAFYEQGMVSQPSRYERSMYWINVLEKLL